MSNPNYEICPRCGLPQVTHSPVWGDGYCVNCMRVTIIKKPNEITALRAALSAADAVIGWIEPYVTTGRLRILYDDFTEAKKKAGLSAPEVRNEREI